MGQQINAQEDSSSDYVRSINELCKAIVERYKKPWLKSSFIFRFSECGRKHKRLLKIVHGFTKKVIESRKENFQGLFTSKKNRVAFLNVLLDAQLKDPTLITNEYIQDEVDTIMFAGHDTTTAALYYTTFTIATNPDVQKRLQMEIDDVLGNSNRQITADDINKFTYMECVIKETLRLYPPVSFFSREITEDTTLGGYRIPRGTAVNIFVFKVNRDESNFEDPNSFKPERFSQEKSENRDPYCFIPFSAGRRNCLGQKFALMEIKVILANILRNFNLSWKQRPNELKLYADLVLRTENEILISLESRH